VEWRAVPVRRDRLTRSAVFAGLRRAEKCLAKYRKSLIGLAVIKKPVGGDRLTNLLNKLDASDTWAWLKLLA
jgi:hypothetical protein